MNNLGLSSPTAAECGEFTLDAFNHFMYEPGDLLPLEKLAAYFEANRLTRSSMLAGLDHACQQGWTRKENERFAVLTKVGHAKLSN
jgi:hypothetical protein